MQELEKDIANHQPQFEACCDSGNTLSDACEDPEKKAEMDKKIDDLQEEWKKLQDDLNKAKEKLQRAAEGGEKLEGLVGDVLGWIDDVQGRIGKLPPVAVKSGLIDDQIKEQKVQPYICLCMCVISTYVCRNTFYICHIKLHTYIQYES